VNSQYFNTIHIYTNKAATNYKSQGIPSTQEGDRSRQQQVIIPVATLETNEKAL
jgi:hypothetical protein